MPAVATTAKEKLLAQYWYIKGIPRAVLQLTQKQASTYGKDLRDIDVKRDLIDMERASIDVRHASILDDAREAAGRGHPINSQGSTAAAEVMTAAQASHLSTAAGSHASAAPTLQEDSQVNRTNQPLPVATLCGPVQCSCGVKCWCRRLFCIQKIGTAPNT